ARNDESVWRIRTAEARSVSVLLFCTRRQGRAKAGKLCRLGDLAIAQGAQHPEHLAPGREGPAILAPCMIPRLHEVEFLVTIVARAGRGIDLAAALPLLPSILAAAALDGHRNAALAAFIATAAVRALRGAAVSDQHFRQDLLVVRHGGILR